MLLQFKFANYRSFADETVFDMTATPIREHRGSLIEKCEVQALPVAAFYGANASGKSSFFMAFRAMCQLVTNASPNAVKTYSSRPFAFSPQYSNKPTEYEVCFAIEDAEYRYGFEHTNEKIINEYLYKRKLSKNKTVEKAIFERFDGKIECKSNKPEIKKEIEYCASMCVEQSLLLVNLGARNKILEFFNIFNWFTSASSSMLGLHNEEAVISIFKDNTSNSIEFRKNILKLIKEIDKGIYDIESIKSPLDGQDILMSIHRYNNEKFSFPFHIESDGTKKLLYLSYSIFTAIKLGSCCFIDELDMQLHPLLLRKIVHMFKNKDINTKGAQLIFSAHNIINLDSSDLRRDEVWFVEKNDHKSSIFSLYDYEDEDGSDIRSDLDYGKHYLLGRFGAIPFQDKDGDE